MTRHQIELDYRIENGRIRSPGKFEGEAVYIPYYWDEYLNGCADRDDGLVISFYVTPNDRILFPELKGRRFVRLYQRDDGFICEC